jgi:hypothetical protein
MWAVAVVCGILLVGSLQPANAEEGPMIPSKGLVAYYPFNGNADDEDAGEHPGRVLGATPTEDRFGRPNHAYSFDGIDDEIVIDLPPQLEPKAFTLSLWVRLARDQAPPGWEDIADGGVELSDPIIGQDDGYAVRCFQLCLMGRKLLWHRLNEYHSVVTGWELRADRWYHVAASYDGAEHHLFVDGEEEGTAAPGILKLNGCEPIRIGSKGDELVGERTFFEGAIDDIRLYGRALTEEEIRALFHEAPQEPD